MLAERRRKVIYSNPRGLLWANDKAKYGKRLLESMGWKEGKGLGKLESGITENIKANFKFDSKGLGYKLSANNLVEENQVYEQILQDLAKHHNSDSTNKSECKSNLEHKTKTSNRLHYSKFIKAKNLSTKSKEDLLCIFPTTKCNENDANSKVISDLKTKNCTNELEESSFRTIKQNISVQDYFKQKLNTKSTKRSKDKIQSTTYNGRNATNNKKQRKV